MKKIKKVLALLLALALALSLLPAAAIAEEEAPTKANPEPDPIVTGTSDNDGMYFAKTFDPSTQMLKLESYAMGEIITTVTEEVQPCDIVLVLDVSGSMEDTMSNSVGTYVRRNGNYSYRTATNGYYYYKENGTYYAIKGEVSNQRQVPTKVSYWLSPNSVTTTPTTTWQPYGSYYYCVSAEQSDYRQLYYKLQGSGALLDPRYYCFSYLDNGSYIPVYGTTGTTFNTGMWGSANLANYDIYTMVDTFDYRIYYTDNEGQTQYLGDTVTSTSTTIYSGKLYQRSTSNVSKMQALQAAVDDMIDVVTANAKENDIDHKISIVKFADDSYYGGEAASLTEGNHRNGDGYNYTEVVKNLTDTRTGSENLKDAVYSLVYGGATAADYGMTKAQYVLGIEKGKEKEPDGRAKVVVMFTDGEPNHQSGFDTTVATNTVKNSKALGADVKVYTVGVFNNPGTNINNYMNAVSSNYPNATAYNILGEGANRGFYQNASGAMDLSGIFTNIAHETTEGGTSVTLNSKTVIKDVLSPYYQLPDGADETSIKIYVVPYDEPTGTFTEDRLQWTDVSGQEPFKVELNPGADGRKNVVVDVSGFNFAEHWCGKGAKDGQKVVIEFRIALVEGVELDSTIIPTNGSTSGIYDEDGHPAGNFPVPTNDLADEEGHSDAPKFFNVMAYEDFGVTDAKPRLFTIDNKQEYDVPLVFDFTTIAAKDNMLYAGTFVKDEESGELVPIKNPTAFCPEQNATYYIKEVSPEHLLPKNLCVWAPTKELGDNKYDVTALYLLTAVDDVDYQECGFIVNGNQRYTAKEDGQAVVYNTLQIQQGSNDPVPYTYGKTSDHWLYDTYLDAKICCLSVDYSDYTTWTVKPATVRAYWVTLDGVEVKGTVERSLTYRGIIEGVDGQKMTVEDEAVMAEATAVVKEEQHLLNAKPMLLKSTYLFGSQPSVTPTEIPVAEPEESEEPEEPEVPEEPIVVEPETITVVDNGKTYAVEIENGSVAGKLTPAGASKKLFTGWYTDAACTKAANLAQVADGMTVYAGYVSNSYLQVKYSGSAILKKLSLASAIPAGQFAETGFLVKVNGTTQKLAVSKYSTTFDLLSAGSLFGSGVEKKAPLMVYDYKLTGLKNKTDLIITPYWITNDGTQVCGTPRTLTYTTLALRG